jgi:hypothetical protein
VILTGRGYSLSSKACGGAGYLNGTKKKTVAKTVTSATTLDTDGDCTDCKELTVFTLVKKYAPRWRYPNN